MNKKLVATFCTLIIITIISVKFSSIEGSGGNFIVLALSVLKFIGISFLFMELLKAHLFWKVLVIVFLALFTLSIVVVS